MLLLRQCLKITQKVSFVKYCELNSTTTILAIFGTQRKLNETILVFFKHCVKMHLQFFFALRIITTARK